MIFAIEGINGCGKTTVINKLKEDISSITVLSIKDKINNYSTLVHHFQSRNTFDLPNNLILNITAAHLELIEEAIFLSANKKIVVLDRSLPSHYVYQINGHNLYTDYLKKYEYIVKCVYLNTPLDVITERLVRRKDSEHLIPHIDDIHHRYNCYFENEFTGFVLTIDCTDIDKIISEVISYMFSFVSNFKIREPIKGDML